MLFALALVVTAAQPEAKPAPEVMLVLDVAGSADVAAAHGLTDLLATTLLDKADMTVTAASSVRDRLQHESDKIEAGCDDNACMAEIAGAIGARVVVFSRLSTAGDLQLLRLEAFDEHLQKSVSVVTVRAKSVGAIYDEVPRAVDELIARSDGAIPVRQTASPVVDAPGFFDHRGNGELVLGGAVFGVGAVAAVAYAIPTAIMNGRNNDVEKLAAAYQKDPSADAAAAVKDARARVDEVKSWQVILSPAILVAVGGLGAGALIAAVGAKDRLTE